MDLQSLPWKCTSEYKYVTLNNGVKNRLDLYQVQKRPSMIMQIVALH